MTATEERMRIAIGNFPVASDERLAFAKQLGVNGVVLNTSQLPAIQRWEYMDIPHTARRWEYLDLVELRTRCENHGLRLEGIENVPPEFYDKAMLGLPGRDQQIGEPRPRSPHRRHRHSYPRLPLDAEPGLAHVILEPRPWRRGMHCLRHGVWWRCAVTHAASSPPTRCGRTMPIYK